jgi:hypothetical protein
VRGIHAIVLCRSNPRLGAEIVLSIIAANPNTIKRDICIPNIYFTRGEWGDKCGGSKEARAGRGRNQNEECEEGSVYEDRDGVVKEEESTSTGSTTFKRKQDRDGCETTAPTQRTLVKIINYL